MEFEDDEDLLRELEELEEQQLEETMLHMPTATTTTTTTRTREPEIHLPQVPSNGLVRPQAQQQVHEEEDEDLEALRALEAEMMG